MYAIRSYYDRDRFFVQIPYTVGGERPETADLVIRSQGCADIGICYPPQVWTETIKLVKAKAAAPKLQLRGSGQRGLGLTSNDEFPPVDEVFSYNFV